MALYRVYTIGLDSHISGVEPIECADDQAAILKAEQLMNGRDVEVWALDRFVARLTCKLIPAPT
jgi:hypothetical protein